ncbi:MAG: hydroxypyruvate isomerase family protein [Chitinophagaceae bacterium]
MKQSPRREVLKRMGVAAIAALTPAVKMIGQEKPAHQKKAKGNIHHSVCSWTYSHLSLPELCDLALSIGIKAIDLVAPKDWSILKEKGLHCSMCYTAGKVSLTEGWNKKENHAWLIKDYLEAFPLLKKAGYQNLICFSGNRNGSSDEEGLENMREGIQKILPLAEKAGVTLQLELFNSKVDHKDYMADRSTWGIELCKRLGSSNFKLLFDIYHMQISEGDIIRTIQDNHEYFGHYHTAGVPGRHEIDESQELNYPAIMKAIASTGYAGYVAQEFIPSSKDPKEKAEALKKAISICDI